MQVTTEPVQINSQVLDDTVDWERLQTENDTLRDFRKHLEKQQEPSKLASLELKRLWRQKDSMVFRDVILYWPSLNGQDKEPKEQLVSQST